MLAHDGAGRGRSRPEREEGSQRAARLCNQRFPDAGLRPELHGRNGPSTGGPGDGQMVCQAPHLIDDHHF
jgi:hypothetical protein